MKPSIREDYYINNLIDFEGKLIPNKGGLQCKSFLVTIGTRYLSSSYCDLEVLANLLNPYLDTLKKDILISQLLSLGNNTHKALSTVPNKQ